MPGDGPEAQWNYCPWWVPAFWEVRDSGGAYKVWELWGIDWYKGIEQVALVMGSVLRNAEATARNQYQKYIDENPGKGRR